uniref:Triple gene block protein 2 n=1 Tax=Cassava common mosaic virus TaxID=39046 RepID=A0A8F9SF51_9VIRU|nr:triple gene block protein 2 [Cassava common mosaic virus]UXW87890.1 triple gene block protein 2 [Cassava common mosaic virus]
MSGHHHLTPPADYSKAVLAAVIGISSSIFIHTITRSTHPHVGDNIHALPHGGYYRDGTKTVYYGGPTTVSASAGKFWAFLCIFTISGFLFFTNRHRTNFSCSCRPNLGAN